MSTIIKGKILPMRAFLRILLSTGLIASLIIFIPNSAKAAISTNGLVLHLDAGDSNSYSGSGTTWSDLSQSGKNGTLVNGPTIQNSNGKYFAFDGVNDYVQMNTIDANFSAGFTATFYANFGTAQSWERLMDFGTATERNNIIIARNSTTQNLTVELWNGTGVSSGYCTASNAITNSTWAHYAITLDGANCKIYRNGLLFTSISYTGLPSISNRTASYLGKSNWPSDGYFDSGIGELSLYNRAISSGEVWQNFKAQADFCSTSITSSSTTRYAQITSGDNCLWIVPSGVTSIDYLIVGGGGGGGGANNGSLGAGGGGGGGQATTSTNFAVTSNASLSLTIGTGGAAGTVNANGGNGTATKLNNFTNTYTANGGNGGQGAPGTNSQFELSGDGGNAGGGNLGASNNWDGGGGGGGAGSAGTAGTDIGGQGGNGGAGGTGVTSTAAPNLTYYFGAGGGGGGTPSNNVSPDFQTDGFGALGGSGVGGNGGVVSSTKTVASAGAVNTGSGGGGGGWNATYVAWQKAGGRGADGVIWIKFTRGTSTISSISISSSAGPDSQYTFGETITVTVIFSDTVTITGTPRIPVQGLSSKYFTYASGSDSSAILFSYVVGSSDLDTDGVLISVNSLELNSGSIKDLAGIAVTLTHSAISASSSYYVDGRLIGSVTGISTPLPQHLDLP